MSFGPRIVISGIAAIGAGALLIAMSLGEPLAGMEPTPIWKGALTIVLGFALLGYGIKYIIHERN